MIKKDLWIPAYGLQEFGIREKLKGRREGIQWFPYRAG
jgi:hypothetical protein